MKLTEKSGHIGLITSTLVDINNYFSYYVLGNSDNYEFFKPIPLENLTSKKNNFKKFSTYLNTSSTHTTT